MILSKFVGPPIKCYLHDASTLGNRGWSNHKLLDGRVGTRKVPDPGHANIRKGG